MSRTLPFNHLQSIVLVTGVLIKDGVPFCIKHWRKLSLYFFLTLVALTLIYGFALWAVGSYKVLSDDPTVWQSSIDKLNAEDRIKPPNTSPVTLFVGSSSIRMFKNLEALFPNNNILKKGFGGAKINDLAYYKESLIFNYAPSTIVLYIGINDMLYRSYDKVSELTTDLFLLTNEIQQRLPDTSLVFLAIRPFDKKTYIKDIDAFNLGIAQYASKHSKVHFVDANTSLIHPDGSANDDLLMWDGLHLNQQGYQAWGTQIHDQLTAMGLTQ